MISTDFLRQLDSFDLVIKKKVTSSFTGERRSDIVGSGLIFRDYVNYNFGDDFKNIDWKVYARSDRLYSKRYEEDRNLTVHIIVDFSGSMNFGRKIKKYEYSSMIALGFAYIALKNNENFVLSSFGDKLEFFRYKKGKKQIASILDYLNKKQASGVTNFYDSLISYKGLVNSRSLIVIISDFFYDLGQIESILNRFKKNKIMLIQVLDELERKFDMEGDYNLEDLESDSKLHTFVDPYLRKKYFEYLEKHQDSIKKVCNKLKVDFQIVDTGEDIFDVFYRILY